LSNKDFDGGLIDIASLNRNEMAALIGEFGEPRFRAGQVWRWVAGGAKSFGDMQNLPKALREKLTERAFLYTSKLLQRQTSADGTEKLLWELIDGETVECVVMSYKHGNTVCISTQVGCRMGCAFCASTVGGLVRNLTAAEMVSEVRMSGEATGKPISNVVLMGIGEPLDNFENVLRFLEIIDDVDGLNIGMRHISLSTCGIPGGIEKLAERDLQITLSVSLHAPDDATRTRLMPVNKSMGVRPLIKQCEEYRKKTGRRMSYEYLLADGVNDSDAQAAELASLLWRSDAHVNLIPLNLVDGAPLKPSVPERVKSFVKILESRGVNVTVRRRMGDDIDAACGQLRRRKSSDGRG